MSIDAKPELEYRNADHVATMVEGLKLATKPVDAKEMQRWFADGINPATLSSLLRAAHRYGLIDCRGPRSARTWELTPLGRDWLEQSVRPVFFRSAVSS